MAGSRPTMNKLLATGLMLLAACWAAQAEGLGRIVVAGGVGANKLLRKEIAERFPGEV